MHFILLTYQSSQLSPAYLKCVQNTYISLQLGNIIKHKDDFYNNILNISCDLLNSALKVKSRMAIW